MNEKKKKKGKYFGVWVLRRQRGRLAASKYHKKTKRKYGKHALNKFVFKKFVYNSILLKSRSTRLFFVLNEKVISANFTTVQSTHNWILMILSIIQNKILVKSSFKIKIFY